MSLNMAQSSLVQQLARKSFIQFFFVAPAYMLFSNRLASHTPQSHLLSQVSQGGGKREALHYGGCQAGRGEVEATDA